MGKPTMWILLIFLMIIPLLGVYVIESDVTEAQTTYSTEASDAITNALYDTAVRVSWDIAEEKSLREFDDAVRSRLAAALNYDRTSEHDQMLLDMKIPAMAFCDNSGFRLVYYVIQNQGSALQFIKTVTPYQPYTQDYGQYSIRLTYNGNVEVIDRSRRTRVEGQRTDIYKTLGAPTDLAFLNDADDYSFEMGLCVTRLVGRELEGITENFLYGADATNTYTFIIPESDTAHTRSITRPSVIMMFQGGTMDTVSGSVDVYCMSAAELQVAHKYTVKEDMYYHMEGSSCAGADIFAGSIDECAEFGAVPCPDCFD